MSEQQSQTTFVPEWDQADRMRKALRTADVGVQELADYLDVSRNTVGTWINGRIQPSTQTLRLVALRCGVPFEWLRDGTEPQDGPDPDGTTSDLRDDRLSCTSHGPGTLLMFPVSEPTGDAQRAA